MSSDGSLWLVPDPSSSAAASLRTIVNDLARDNTWGQSVSKPFSPHMTITSGISAYFLSSAKKVSFPGYSYVHLDEVKVQRPELVVKELVFGDLFLIFVRLERTDSLLSMVKTLRSQFVGENQDDLDDFMKKFDPHISLAYSECWSGEDTSALKKRLEQDVKQLDLNTAFQFMVLMDTRAKPSTKQEDVVSEWKACPIRLAL